MGVALLNAQSDASAQGGDLEHTGHTFFSTVSANLHIGLVLVHKHGGPRVFLLRGCSSRAPRQGAACRHKPLGLLGGPQENCLLISTVDGRSLPMAGNRYPSRHFVSFPTFLRLVKPKCWILKSFSPSYFTG